jgi:carboxypeptidase-like protein/TonB-dependent receptor-like protein
MIKKILCAIALTLLIGGNIIGQGTVRGNVYDKDSGEPLMYGTVRLDRLSIGSNTDLDGFFSMTNIPAGTYKLIVSYTGYDSTAVEVRVEDGGITYKSVYLESAGIELATVQVSAEKQKARNEVKVSIVTVTPKQIKSLPSIGGEPDLAQYLPVIPGIIFTGDQGGQLYIRGGSPIQNKILLDGMTIYNPFHSIGFFSVFETEAIRSIDVLTGGFNADFGGRISAIVDIKTKEGNKKRLSGIASVNPFQSKILLEGPIKKLKEGGGSTSFLLTGKKSYIDQTSKTLYSYAVDTSLYNFGNADTTMNNDKLGLPYSFTDLYGKLSFVSSNGSKLNLFGFNFNDRVDFTGFADLNWKNFGGGADFTLIPSTSNMIIGGTITFTDYNIVLQELDGAPRESGIKSFSAGLNFKYFGENSEVNYGISIDGMNTSFKFRNFLGLDFSQEESTTEVAAYGKYKLKINKLIIEPGLRFQYYASQAQARLEPRFGLKYNATDKLRFKAAGGTYSQNLISTVNERDVVNLFVGFLTGPEEDILDPATGGSTDNRLQTAYHGIFGVEYDISDRIALNVEPYYKGFTQIINVNRNKIEATDPNYMAETGEAYGIDFSVKYENPTTYLWLTYSLGYVNRFDGEQTYPTIFDRRHNVNALLTYNFGASKLWEVSGRWNFGTGFPFTQTQGFYEQENLENSISTNVLTGNGDLGIIYSDKRNGGRLPVYHRFDLSLKRTIKFSKYSELEAVASVTNLYNRSNIFFVDRITSNRVDQLPILPSFGLVFKF